MGAVTAGAGAGAPAPRGGCAHPFFCSCWGRGRGTCGAQGAQPQGAKTRPMGGREPRGVLSRHSTADNRPPPTRASVHRVGSTAAASSRSPRPGVSTVGTRTNERRHRRERRRHGGGVRRHRAACATAPDGPANSGRTGGLVAAAAADTAAAGCRVVPRRDGRGRPGREIPAARVDVPLRLRLHRFFFCSAPASPVPPITSSQPVPPLCASTPSHAASRPAQPLPLPAWRRRRSRRGGRCPPVPRGNAGGTRRRPLGGAPRRRASALAALPSLFPRTLRVGRIPGALVLGGPPRRPVLWARRRGTRHETDDHLEIWALHGLRWHARRGRPPRTAAATAAADWVTFVQPPRWWSPTTEDGVAGVDPQVAPSAARRGLRGRPVSRESRAAGPPRLTRQTRPRPLEPIHCGRRCAAGARPASWLRRPPGAGDPAVHRQGVHPCKERRARGRGEKGPPRWGRRPRRRPRLAAGGPSGDQRHALPSYPCMGGADGTFRGRVRRGRGRGTDPPRPVHCNRASGGEWEDAGGSGLYERLLLKRRMG